MFGKSNRRDQVRVSRLRLIKLRILLRYPQNLLRNSVNFLVFNHFLQMLYNVCGLKTYIRDFRYLHKKNHIYTFQGSGQDSNITCLKLTTLVESTMCYLETMIEISISLTTERSSVLITLYFNNQYRNSKTTSFLYDGLY